MFPVEYFTKTVTSTYLDYGQPFGLTIISNSIRDYYFPSCGSHIEHGCVHSPPATVLSPVQPGCLAYSFLHSPCPYYFSHNFLKNIYLFIWEEARRERESPADFLLSAELPARLHPTTPNSQPRAEIKSQTLNWLNHPGTPATFLCK